MEQAVQAQHDARRRGRPVIIGPLIEAAFLTAAGLAVAVSYFWWHDLWLPFVGVFIAGFGTSALIAALRRPRRYASRTR